MRFMQTIFICRMKAGGLAVKFEKACGEKLGFFSFGLADLARIVRLKAQLGA